MERGFFIGDNFKCESRVGFSAILLIKSISLFVILNEVKELQNTPSTRCSEDFVGIWLV